MNDRSDEGSNSPTPGSIRWLITLRLVVITTLLVGALIIQVTMRKILPLSGLYALSLATYLLSLGYLVLHQLRVHTKVQASLQLVGDIGIITGFIYVTGGVHSPFSFLYLVVVAAAAVLIRGGGLIFAGLSAVAYGVLIDLMAFQLIPMPSGVEAPDLPFSRLLYQLLINVIGFALVAVLVSYLSESLRTAHSRLSEEQARSAQMTALAHHVVQSVGSGILALDTDGRVLQINPAGVHILGLDDPQQALGKPVSDVLPLAVQHWGPVLSRSKYHGPLRIEALIEPDRRVGVSVGVLTDDSRQRVGFVVNFQDISQVQLEMQRKALHDRMVSLGEMAARMAHEIRNPLASISGSAQMLSASGSTDTSTRRLLGIVVEESQRLSALLEGFLNYTRPRTGRKSPCDITTHLIDCIELLRSSDEVHDEHDVIIDAPEELTVAADPDLLRQVFWNLTRNALQAMPDGGTLRIRVERTEDTVVMQWIDTGIGMEPEMTGRVFEPFVTTRNTGSGLGLAIVYSAVMEHHGTVEIDSSAGQGTTVTVELPIEPEP